MDGSCTESIITVNDNFVISDVNIIDLQGTYPDMGDLSFALTSPEGTIITLLAGQCPVEADFDVSLDDEADNALTALTCAPLGGADTFQPLSPLAGFFGENAMGDWTLQVFGDNLAAGTLDNWVLQIGELQPYSQGDTLLSNDEGLCSAEFTYTHPIAADACGEGSVVVSFEDANAPGGASSISLIDPITLPGGGPVVGGQQVTYTFAVGTTTVIYTLTDGSGNVSTCSFQVTVIDDEAPMWANGLGTDDICQDINVALEGGQCTAIINYPNILGLGGGSSTPLVTDNCGIEDVTFLPEAGFDFPIGTTEVTIVITDAAGNELTCTFNVNVIEFEVEEGATIVCNDNINLSLGPDCTAEINADMLLEGSNYGCYDDYEVTLTNAAGQEIGNSTDGTNFVGLDEVGQIITATVCSPDPIPNCCSTDILIELKLIPEVEYPADTLIFCNNNISPDSLGYPEILTCEQEINITYSDDFVDFGLCSDPRAEIIRTWTITDESNNILQGTQTITIGAFYLDNVEFPADQTIETSLDCDDVANDPTLMHPDSTGYPLINGQEIQLGS